MVTCQRNDRAAVVLHLTGERGNQLPISAGIDGEMPFKTLQRGVQNARIHRFAMRHNHARERPRLLRDRLHETVDGGRVTQICRERPHPGTGQFEFGGEDGDVVGLDTPGHARVVGLPIVQDQVPAVGGERAGNCGANAHGPAHAGDESYFLMH